MTMYTQRKRPERNPEYNSGEKKVESAGHISAQQQIMNIINAGKRLTEYRKENYDFKPGEKEYDFPIPDRRPNFDMADASEIAENVNERLENQAEAKKLAEKEKADKEDQKNRENEEKVKKFEKNLEKE